MGAQACSHPGDPEPQPRNVILICWDTVRADHIGAYGYGLRPTTPALDALARESIVFADTSSTAGWTKPSVPSFLTGMMPAEHGVFEGSAGFELGKTTDVLPDAARSLAEVFQEQGFRTAAFIKNAQLRPGNGFEQGFETYVDEVGDARDIRWAGLDWLDSVGADESFFLYLHALDAHWPYDVPVQAATRFVSGERARPFQDKSFKETMEAVHHGEIDFPEESRDDLVALYDGALRYLDDQLGLLLEGLEIRGLRENTVVIVIADHGEEFGEHGRIGHGHGLYQGLLQVPFVMHVPGQAARRVEHPVSLLDLFPTLLGVFGIETPEHLLGVDRLRNPTADRPILAEHKAPKSYLQAVRVPSQCHVLVRDARPPKDRGANGRWSSFVGERMEIDLEWDGSGFHATEVELDDDDPQDPTELKGTIRGLGANVFQLSTLMVRFDEGTELKWGSDVLDHELRNGRGVKAEGEFKDGVFHAVKLKLYPLDAEIGLVLRGVVSETEMDADSGTLVVGGVTVQVDDWTDLDLPSAGKSKRRMSRDAIIRYLELGGEEAQQEGYRLTAWRYDLDADPDELQRVDLDPLDGDSLLPLMEQLGRALIQRRVFSQEDRIDLTPDAIEALRDIGYAR